MTYNWDIKEIKKTLLELEELKNRAVCLHNPAVDDIEGEIDNINDVINAYYGVDIKDDDSDYIDRGHFITRNNYSDLLEIPDNVHEDVEKSFLFLKDLYDTYEEINLPKTMYNPNELVELSRDFGDWLPTKNSVWKDSFTRFSDSQNHLLKFRRFAEDDFSGITYFNYFPSYTPHFLIKRRYNINDFITLIHEFAHGTIGLYGQSKCMYTSEIEGWYFQFLGRKFLQEKKIVPPKQVKQLEYNDFSIVFDYYIAIILYDVCKYLKDNKKGLNIYRIKTISSKFFNYLAINQTLLKNYLDVSPIEDYTYLYSYLLSLDLEAKFNDDPELNFYNFYNVATGTDINHNSLRSNGITFMDDEYKSLRKKIERINTF